MPDRMQITVVLEVDTVPGTNPAKMRQSIAKYLDTVAVELGPVHNSDLWKIRSAEVTDVRPGV